MAMKVKNNLSAMRSLGQLNINITELGKALARVSSGQKINSAGDDASGMAISERMRVRIRALEQDIQNVKNGRAMLDTAEGGIQRQLDLMRTIKAKVIDAANDSNTEEDRLTIQKEIDHHFKEIQSIAYETDFNGIKLLIGNEPLRKTVIDWKVLDTPEFVEDSDIMDVIPDNEPGPRDGIEGPFDLFSLYSGIRAKAVEPLLGASTSVNLRDAGEGTPAEFELDLSGYSLSDLDGQSFTVFGYDENGSYGRRCYILTTDASKSYNTRSTQYDLPLTPIQISSVADAASKIAAAVGSMTSNQGNSCFDASVSGTKATFTSKNKSTTSNGCEFTGFNVTQKTISASTPSGMPSGTFSPAQATQYRTETETVSSGDASYPRTKYISDKAATGSTFTVDNISDYSAGTGFVVTGYNGRESYVKFVDGNDISTDSDGIVCVGLGIVGSGQTKSALLTQLKGDPNGGSTIGISISVDDSGKMTLTSTETYNDFYEYSGIYNRRDYINNYSVSAVGFGSQETSGTLPATWERTVDGDDGASAHYDIDLTAYDTTDTDKLEEFIDDLKGNVLNLRYRYNIAQYPTYFTTTNFEFIDAENPLSMDAVPTTNYTAIDLNRIRTSVAGGTTIADAFISLMQNYNYGYYQPQFSDESDDTKKILRITSRLKGEDGTQDTVNLYGDGKLAQYPIDYDSWFENNLSSIDTTLDKYLNNKGFRFYCASCADQWFNVIFSSGEGDDEAPESISGSDLHTIRIDVSSLSDIDNTSNPNEAAARLVELICEQGNQAVDHYYRFAADDGVLTIYDTRREYLSTYSYPTLREGGLAKISDGVYDDVIKTEVEIPVNEKRLVIQDTDKDSQQIILHIPQSTLSHIFGLSVDNPSDMSRYTVLTKSNRDFLLGERVPGADAGSELANKNLGALDKGINYLLDAITLVGAQGARLQMTETNVTTQLENETNSESTIRDADMAKEMTSYTKANVLSQAAQAMLAQANQNSSAVLSLLQ